MEKPGNTDFWWQYASMVKRQTTLTKYKFYYVRILYAYNGTL